MITRQLDITKIIPNPEQPRRLFDEAARLQELAASIKDRGLLQPILVEEVGDGTYILHAGERRLRAHQLLKRQSIAARVMPALNGDGRQERLLNAFVENTMREDMSPMEEARALGELQQLGLTMGQISQKTGMNLGTIEGRLVLLRLDEPLQELVDRELLPRDPRAARAIMSIEDPAVRVKLGTVLARPGVTIKAIQAACERVKEQMRQTSSSEADSCTAPMIALSNAGGQREATVKWRNARAAAAAVCNDCDVKQSLRDVPEPAWSLLLTHADAVCTECSMRPTASASLNVCKACPAVDLLKKLAGSTR